MRRYVLFLTCILVSALAAQNLNYTLSGILGPDQTVITTNTEATLTIPNVEITGKVLELIPVFVIGEHYFRYRKLLNITNPTENRTSETIEITVLGLTGKKQTNCFDVIITDTDGAPINHETTECAQDAITLRINTRNWTPLQSKQYFFYYDSPQQLDDTSITVPRSLTITWDSGWKYGSIPSSDNNWSTYEDVQCARTSGPHTVDLGAIPGGVWQVGGVYIQGRTMSQTYYAIRKTPSATCSAYTYGDCTMLSGLCSGGSGNYADFSSSISSSHVYNRYISYFAISTHYATHYCGLWCNYDRAYEIQFSRKGTHPLQSEAGPQEVPQLEDVIVYQSGVPLLDTPQLNITNITIDTTPATYQILVATPAQGTVFIKSYIQAQANRTLTLNQTFFQNTVLYSGILDPAFPGNVTFSTPATIINPQSNQNFVFNNGIWSFSQTPTANFNFSSNRQILTLNSILAPKLVFTPSGVPASEDTRACFDGTCYLKYNFSEYRNIQSLGKLNLGDEVDIELTMEQPGICSLGEYTNTSTGTTCQLNAIVNESLQLHTFNETDWSAGYLDLNYTTNSLDITGNFPNTATLGQQVEFSGKGIGSVTRAGVNGTALVVFGVQHTLVEVLEGEFSGQVITPDSASKILVIVLDPPEEEQIWGFFEQTISVYNPATDPTDTHLPSSFYSGTRYGAPSSGSPSCLDNSADIKPFLEKLSFALSFGQQTPQLQQIEQTAQETFFSPPNQLHSFRGPGSEVRSIYRTVFNPGRTNS